jgi:hypothetical protein
MYKCLVKKSFPNTTNVSSLKESVYGIVVFSDINHIQKHEYFVSITPVLESYTEVLLLIQSAVKYLDNPILLYFINSWGYTDEIITAINMEPDEINTQGSLIDYVSNHDYDPFLLNEFADCYKLNFKILIDTLLFHYERLSVNEMCEDVLL